MTGTQALARWRDHLGAGALAGPYDYPLEEALTEPSEAAQDAGKRDRERAAIALELEGPWTAALDFGCGVGANFDLFGASSGRRAGAFLIGLDPDARRAAAAARRLEQTASIPGLVAGGGQEALAAPPGDLVFDVVLACQVLGHTARAQTEAILSRLRSRLAPGGRLLIALPVVMPAAREFLFARDWTGRGDLFHMVRPSLGAVHEDFRTLLTAEAFDSAAACSPEGELPVRAFEVEQAEAGLSSLPRDLPSPPQSLAALLGDAVEIRTQLYSIHAFAAHSGLPAIGDALLTVTDAEA